MGRWTRYRLPIVVGLVLVGGVGVGTVWAFSLKPADRSDVLALLGIGLGLVGVLPLLARPQGGRRFPDPRPVEVLATLLAQAVYGQWRKAADERRLVTPAPIPIRWSLSELDVAGPVAAAIGAPDQLPAFPPLPGHTTITEEELRAGGGRRELHQLFAGLASGRIVVVGEPGAGKSGAAILLLLDALAHRDSLDDTHRARAPVPVLFTGHGWDPNTTSVQNWLRDRLVATYPLFQRRGGDADAAALVAARDKVALILDGLDEMDEALRPTALQALSDAPFRVIVLTRSQEMVRAACKAWLVGAVAVHLRDVTGPEAADYLQRARTGPPPAGWPSLLAHLREHPDGVLTRGLSTPLALTLIRDTYQASDNVGELLDATRYRSTEAIEQHLIARVLPAAYVPRPGRPAPRYSEEKARQALTFIARKMGKERDLAWWHIPSWAPVTPRILTEGLVNGLMLGLAGGLGFGLVAGLDPELKVGVGFGLMVGLVVGLVGGLALGLVGGLVGGLVVAVRRGLGRGLGRGVGGEEPLRVKTANWRTAISRQVLRKGLGLGTGGGLVVGLVVGLGDGIRDGLGAGVGFGLIVGLAYVLRNMFFEGGASEGSPLGPSEIWRNDRLAGFGLGFGGGLMGVLGGWLGAVLGGGLEDGLAVMLVFVLGGGVVIGLRSALTYTEIWPTTLAWLQLRRAGHVPAVSLMPFLEDARQRGVLRTVGGVYQFRHATLQDQLADQTVPSCAVSQVS